MPRAPPTARMVSLMALPAPAWRAGTVVMMVVLAGAITSPMPAPMIATARASGGEAGGPAPGGRASRPKPLRGQPAGVIQRGPERAGRGADGGAGGRSGGPHAQAAAPPA